MTKIKVCCISSIQEANSAIEAGADAIGLVGNMPSGPGVISDELIKEIAGSVPQHILTFLLTSETDTDKIIEHHSRTKTNTIQIVDKIKIGRYQDLRNALPAIKLVQVVHVIDQTSIDYAVEVSSEVDMLLLDSGNPNAEIKTLGGTGQTHNWSLSRRIIEAVNIPVFLAGGLNPGNAANAIEEVNPFGLDLCSGVRTDCKLDEQKLKSFFKAAGR